MSLRCSCPNCAPVTSSSWIICRAIKRASVRERIEAAGATLRFLPPYSPDFNPIEKGRLCDLIGNLVDIFQPNECANYFSSCDDPE